MTPEDYLTQLIYNSRFGPLAASPHSELRKMVDNLSIDLVSGRSQDHTSGKNQGSSLVTHESHSAATASDALLASTRDRLLPFFPPEFQKQIPKIPVGVIYNMTFEEFAAPVPGGGAVVAIDMALMNLLELNDMCIHSLSPEAIQRLNGLVTVFAYAAAKCIHFILAAKGEVLPPLLPKLQQDRQVALERATSAFWQQMEFIIAHEYSHICLGHVDPKTSERSREIFQAHELQADEAAAKVLLAQAAQSKARTSSFRRIEVSMGIIAAVLHASDAILAVSHKGKAFTTSYPNSDDRFDQVIEVFRQRYGNELMAADLYMRPFGLISHVFGMLRSSPLEAMAWLSDIALECKGVGDRHEELFIVSIAKEAARIAGDSREVRQIERYIMKNISVVPDLFAESIMEFRL